jgi:hypothetical protein
MSQLEYIKLVCGGGLMCLFHLALAGSSVAYLVCAIIFLVKDYGVCGDTSPLWVLVLVSVIAPIFLNIVRTQNQPPDNQSEEFDSVTPIAIFLLLVTEVTVGGVLIYGENRTCESMKHTGLWVVALVLFWSLLSALFLIIAIGLFSCAVGVLGTFETATPVTQKAIGVNPSSISVTIVSSEESV